MRSGRISRTSALQDAADAETKAGGGQGASAVEVGEQPGAEHSGARSGVGCAPGAEQGARGF
jgi:hypothetical protein